jgi:hypothetical protein
MTMLSEQGLRDAYTRQEVYKDARDANLGGTDRY